ncbi:MAG: hypothetical protein PHH84_03860 [Oscillospiraceae bacterium]|nr:hypothetical protein [Oscillospiraceae bacterium]
MNKFDASLQIINAIISIDNYVVGINVPSGDVTVQGSRITVTNADCGISGGNEIDNFLIQGSVLDLTGEGVSSVGLLNGRDIQIDSSLIKITSQNSNAVYTDGAITVRNGSVLEMKAFYPALFSTLDTTITDSTVIAISTDDSGIYSRANILINGTSDILARGHWAGINANGNITINSGKIYSTSSHDMGIYLRGIFTMNGGDVYAQGATGFAAIGARYTKQEGDTEPVEKIVINSNYADIGGGKVSVSDWYSGASGEINWSRSWSSFVAGNDGNTKSNYNYSIIIAHGAFFLY